MSNLHSHDVAAMFGRGDTYGFAWARGKDSMFDAALDLLNTTMLDDTILGDGSTARPYYDHIRFKAEQAAIAAGKPLPEMKTKSRDSQRSKLANFETLGVYARSNDDVVKAITVTARSLSESKYTPFVACAVACKKELAKNPNADHETLHEAMKAALETEPELASEAVRKLRKSWETLAYGKSADEPSKHEGMFHRLLAAEPADYAKHVDTILETIAQAFEKMEKADKPVVFPKI